MTLNTYRPRQTLLPGPPPSKILPCVPPQPPPSSGLRALAAAHSWVLVIDDDRLSGQATARFIRGAGLQARLARTAQQALYLSSSELKPVGIVSDFQLGGELDGVELLRTLRARGVSAPALMLTGASRLAQTALSASDLSTEVPVLERGVHLGSLLEWLFPLGMMGSSDRLERACA